MKTFSLLLFVFVNLCIAQTTNINPSEISKINQDVSKEIKPKFVPTPSSKKTTLELSCQTGTGKIIHMNEPGYEECLAMIRHKQDINKINPASDTVDKTNGQDASFIINFKKD